jgi:hypothetical protein
MQRQVFKYGPLGFHATVEVVGRPVHLGIQNNGLYLWCEVFGTEENRHLVNTKYNVQMYGTGDPYRGDCIGSVIDEAGFVWHAVAKEIEYIYDESGFVIGSTEKRIMQ